jgi:hypothetical protein
MRSRSAWIAQDAWWRATGAAALAVVAVYFAYTASKFHLVNLSSLGGDAFIVYQKALAIAESGRYPAQSTLGNFNEIFPYPPPSVLIFAMLGRLGPGVFMMLWEVATFLALYASVRFSVQYENERTKGAWPLLVLAAIVLTYNPIEYDLASKNDNLIILAITMSSFALLGRRPAASGVALALAISLKLYSGLLLPWLLFVNRRAAASCIVALVGLWLVAPALYWGGDGLVQIYRGWFDQLAIANGRWVYALPGTGLGPPLITLRLAASKILMADPFAGQVRLLLLAMQLGWLGVLASYIYRAWWRASAPDAWRAKLADWSVLLLAPLPFSPWLEPYHAVALIPGFALCILLLIDETQSRPTRLTAAFACLAAAVVKELPTPFEMRGLVFLAQFVFVTAALSVARPRLVAQVRVAAP